MIFLEPRSLYRMKTGIGNQLKVVDFGPSPETVLVSTKQLAARSSINESFQTEQAPQGIPIKIFAFCRA